MVRAAPAVIEEGLTEKEEEEEEEGKGQGQDQKRSLANSLDPANLPPPPAEERPPSETFAPPPPPEPLPGPPPTATRPGPAKKQSSRKAALLAAEAKKKRAAEAAEEQQEAAEKALEAAASAAPPPPPPGLPQQVPVSELAITKPKPAPKLLPQVEALPVPPVGGGASHLASNTLRTTSNASRASGAAASAASAAAAAAGAGANAASPKVTRREWGKIVESATGAGAGGGGAVGDGKSRLVVDGLRSAGGGGGGGGGGGRSGELRRRAKAKFTRWVGWAGRKEGETTSGRSLCGSLVVRVLCLGCHSSETFLLAPTLLQIAFFSCCVLYCTTVRCLSSAWRNAPRSHLLPPRVRLLDPRSHPMWQEKPAPAAGSTHAVRRAPRRRPCLWR